ncbi:hypothetical protein ACFFRR_003781 [Megaselia abdita]
MSYIMATHRRRLGSTGDSAPPSESSEGTSSENCDLPHPDWSLSSDHQSSSHHTNTGSIYTNSEIDDSLSVSTNSANTLSEDEREQVESFFSGLGTEIYVSTSLANLYQCVGKDDWRLLFTGIPVILHDTGFARSRSVSTVTLCLAERGSSFALWSDKIDNLSNYRISGPSFHTMCSSTDRAQMMGFSFDSNESATDLFHCLEKLTKSPDNLTIESTKKKKNSKKHKRGKPAPLPPKSQISQPCQFHHVTSVTRNDTERLFSMQAFLPAAFKHR